MNITKNSIWIGVFLLCLAQSVHAQSTVTIRDFLATPFDYGYEGWKDLGSIQSKTANGVEIKGSAKGGVGAFFNDPLDLLGSKQIEIKIKKGAGNTDDNLQLKLISADGKSSSWKISFADISDSKFTTLTYDLGTVRGVKDAVDLETIRQLQIQGTFNPTNQVDFEIASITATGTAPPAPAAPTPASAPAPASPSPANK
jgi:hypothetical protein